MHNEKQIAEEIEQTLNSLDHMQRAEPKPFFFTRLEARLQHAPVTGNAWRFMFNPAVSLGALLLLLVLNLRAITHFTKTQEQPQQEISGLQGLASEMNHDISTLYTDKTNQ